MVLSSILVVASCEKPTGEAPKPLVEDKKDTGGNTPAAPKQWHVSTVAGSGTRGHADATGTAAQFKSPNGIAVFPDGTLYVADTGNHRIRKISPLGVVTTFAGSGDAAHKDGTGTAAQFFAPEGIAVASDGKLYVADTGNHRTRKIDTSGKVTTIAGGVKGKADGTGTAAQFNTPYGIALSPDGRTLYVADSGNHRIRKIALPSGDVTTIAGSTEGKADGTGTTAQFNTPYGIALSSDGRTLYVADTGNYRIRKIEFK